MVLQFKAAAAHFRGGILDAFKRRLVLPMTSIREVQTEADLISQYESAGHTVDDISFANRTEQHSFVQGLKVGDLVISESCMDPLMMKLKSEPQLSFSIPFAGHGTLTEGTQSITLPSSSHIVLTPVKQGTSFKTSGFHCVTFRPSIPKMQAALSKFPLSAHRALDDIVPDYASNFTGHIGQINYLDQLMSLMGIVNGCGGDPDLLARIGFDDVVTMVLAEFLTAATGSPVAVEDIAPPSRSDRSVDIICEHIVNNIGNPLTIPRMEKLTGMTGRAINYAFQKRFGKSPQQWQRDYLLALARRELTSASAPRSVKSIAFDLGFSSSSSFSAHYKRRFGEHPSLTFRGLPSPTRLS